MSRYNHILGHISYYRDPIFCSYNILRILHYIVGHKILSHFPLQSFHLLILTSLCSSLQPILHLNNHQEPFNPSLTFPTIMSLHSSAPCHPPSHVHPTSHSLPSFPYFLGVYLKERQNHLRLNQPLMNKGTGEIEWWFSVIPFHQLANQELIPKALINKKPYN